MSPAASEGSSLAVQNDPLVSHGTRHKEPKLSLDAKRYIVEMYENLRGRKLL